MCSLTGMSVELELECKTHQCFEDFVGSVICPFIYQR